MSDKHCKQCQQPLKLKHLVRAAEGKHRPPDFCYTCLRTKKKGKKTSRERKIELAKKRAREREAAKKGLGGDG